jgi:hypothetical protein
VYDPPAADLTEAPIDHGSVVKGFLAGCGWLFLGYFLFRQLAPLCATCT